MIYLYILFGILAILGLGILVGVHFFKCDTIAPKRHPRYREASEIDNLPRCKCSNVNECETWCRAKALFAKYPPEDEN